MKILFAIKSMNIPRGGAERVLADVASELAMQGHEVSLLTFDQPDGKSVYPLHSDIERSYVSIGAADQRASWGTSLVRMRALRKKIKAEQPDVVIAFMHSMFVPVSFALAGTKIPVIASEHIVPAHYQTRKFEFSLLAVSTLFIESMSVVSENAKRQYPSFIKRKMSVIPNPVSLNFTPPRSAEQKSTDKKNILSVGRLDQQKDQKTLISAFDHIAADYPNWCLRIIGEGDLRPDLEAQINKCSAKDRITLPGISENIGTEYQQADIFVLPSLYESFGLATAEAMAAGLPCVGFADCPGTNELIKHNKNGLLVDSHDRVRGLAFSLKALMNSPDLCGRYGQEARNIIQDYAPDKIAGYWLNHIHQVVGDIVSLKQVRSNKDSKVK